MQDKELYEKLLGLSAPWSVQEVDLQIKEMVITHGVRRAGMEELLTPSN